MGRDVGTCQVPSGHRNRLVLAAAAAHPPQHVDVGRALPPAAKRVGRRHGRWPQDQRGWVARQDLPVQGDANHLQSIKHFGAALQSMPVCRQRSRGSDDAAGTSRSRSCLRDAATHRVLASPALHVPQPVGIAAAAGARHGGLAAQGRPARLHCPAAAGGKGEVPDGCASHHLQQRYAGSAPGQQHRRDAGFT